MALVPIRGNPRGNELLRPHKGAIPLIGIGGSRGKTSIAFLLQAILQNAGLSTGSWTSAGVMAGPEQLEGELHAWERCVLAARVGELDALIQELFSPLTAAIQLPQDVYPLTILTMICGNDDDCRDMDDSRREYRALHRLANATRHGGAMIVNADDLPLLDLALTCEDRELILYAQHAANPALQRHLAAGGSAVWLDDTLIVYSDQGRPGMVIDVGRMPPALGGAMSIYVQNALAAVAAAMVLGINQHIMSTTLQEFQPDPFMMPGSCNVVQIGRTPAVIDRGDQVWSLKTLVRAIKNIPARQKVILYGNLSIPDEDLEEAGRLLASIPNGVLLADWPEPDPRHAALLQGMQNNGSSPPLVIRCSGSDDAVNRLLGHIEPDDLAVILAQDALPYLTALS